MATSAEDAVRDADVVVTVTNSADPVVRGKWLKPGVLVNAVGAVGPKRRELDDDAMRGAVIVDSREAALAESGDILLAEQVFTPSWANCSPARSPDQKLTSRCSSRWAWRWKIWLPRSLCWMRHERAKRLGLRKSG